MIVNAEVFPDRSAACRAACAVPSLLPSSTRKMCTGPRYVCRRRELMHRPTTSASSLAGMITAIFAARSELRGRAINLRTRQKPPCASSSHSQISNVIMPAIMASIEWRYLTAKGAKDAKVTKDRSSYLSCYLCVLCIAIFQILRDLKRICRFSVTSLFLRYLRMRLCLRREGKYRITSTKFLSFFSVSQCSPCLRG